MTVQSPEEIERRLARDRVEIERTVEALWDRVSPAHLLDRGVAYLKDEGAEVGANLARSAQRNPLALILTGVGLAWLISSHSKVGHDGVGDPRMGRGTAGGGTTGGDHAAEPSLAERARAAGAAVRREAGEAEEAFLTRAADAKARVLSMKREVDETAAAYRRRVEDYLHKAEESAAALRRRTGEAMSGGAHAVADGARHLGDRARQSQEQLKGLYASEPLLFGAFAVATGALLASLLPATRSEDRIFGDAGDEIRRTASDAASTAADRGTTVAEETVRAAAQAAEDAVRESSPTTGGPEHDAARSSEDDGATTRAEERPAGEPMHGRGTPV